MTDLQSSLTQLACLEALHNQQQNLVETIGKLVGIMKTLPEGEARSKLVDQISCLDVIAEVTKRALDSFIPPISKEQA
jgi:hypothetical protein